MGIARGIFYILVFLHARGVCGSAARDRALQPLKMLMKWYSLGENRSLPAGATCEDANWELDGLLPARASDNLPTSSAPLSARPIRFLPLHDGSLLVLGLHVRAASFSASDSGKRDEVVMVPRGDVIASSDGGRSWRCLPTTGYGVNLAATAGMTAFVVSRRVRFVNGTTARVQAVCAAGGRPIILSNDVGGGVGLAYGAPTNQVWCSGDGAEWVPAQPLPFNVTAMAHASVLNGTFHVLLGGWRQDESEDALVAEFPDVSTFDEATSPACRLAMPVSWRRLQLASPIMQRARPVMTWMVHSALLAMGGGTVPFFADASRHEESEAPDGSSSSSSSFVSDMFNSTVSSGAINHDTGGPQEAGFALTDMLGLHIAPVLQQLYGSSSAAGGGGAVAGTVPPGAELGMLVEVTKLTGLTLPEARPRPSEEEEGSGTHLASFASYEPSVRRHLDTLVLQVARRLYTAVYDTPSAAFRLRYHLLYGTADAVGAGRPETVDDAPGTVSAAVAYVSPPGGGAETVEDDDSMGPLQTGFLTSMDPITGQIFLGSMMECQPPPGCPAEEHYWRMCRSSPYDSVCTPCTQCVAGMQYPSVQSCGQDFWDRLCLPCDPCPAGEVPAVPCPVPGLTSRAEPLCVKAGRQPLMSATQALVLACLLAFEIIVAAPAALVAAYLSVRKDFLEMGSSTMPATASSVDSSSQPAATTTDVASSTDTSAKIVAALAASAAEQERQQQRQDLHSVRNWSAANAARLPISSAFRHRALFILRCTAAAATVTVFSALFGCLLANRGTAAAFQPDDGAAMVVFLLICAAPAIVIAMMSRFERRRPDVHLWAQLLGSDGNNDNNKRSVRCVLLPPWAAVAPGLLRPRLLLDLYELRLEAKGMRAATAASYLPGPSSSDAMRQLGSLSLCCLIAVDLPLLACTLTAAVAASDVTLVSGPVVDMGFRASNRLEVYAGYGAAAALFALQLAHIVDSALALLSLWPDCGLGGPGHHNAVLSATAKRVPPPAAADEAGAAGAPAAIVEGRACWGY